MADHLWFVPVTGGRGLGSYPGGMSKTLTEFNVQWDFNPFPIGEPQVDWPCIQSMNVTGSMPGSQVGPTPWQLGECYGSWRWRSCALGGVIVTGGELLVGTVLSRFLPFFLTVPQPPSVDPPVGSPSTWNTVEAWVKYRVSATGPLSEILFTLNDRSGNSWSLPLPPPPPPPTYWLATTVAGVWRVIYVKKTGNWTNWNDTNLRAVLTVQGTTNPANVGLVDVDVEWFAFRLSEQLA